MDIVVKGRHTEVPERFRRHVSEKLAKVEKLDHRVIRIDVEVSKERNRRQAEISERVELTVLSKGPVVRAEASADDPYAALDLAFAKLENRLRRAADRRHSRHAHKGGARGLATLPAAGSAADATALGTTGLDSGDVDGSAAEQDEAPEHGPMLIREKEHAAEPMTLDQALYEMELVGHDFYLFVDKDAGRPSVVYRRRGYDYGVIRLVPPRQG